MSSIDAAYVDDPEIFSLVEILVKIGPIALDYIKELRVWILNRSKVNKYKKDLEKKISQIRILGKVLRSYRSLNLHVTHIIDASQVLPKRILNLKRMGLTSSEICDLLQNDLNGLQNYFNQNLANFPTRTNLDGAHCSLIDDLIRRIGVAFSSASTNLQNENLPEFEASIISIVYEAVSIRGETFFASDKMAEEISRI